MDSKFGFLFPCFPVQVQTDFQLVESNKFLITIPSADNINHLVVFMTGLCPLPEGMAGAGNVRCQLRSVSTFI